MKLLDFTFFNFYSTGSLIATIFNIAVILFFLIWPKKSNATSYLILIYFFIMLQNLGYLITSSICHPLTAYHRWLTIFSVFPGLIYIVQFFFYFPVERNVRFARAILIIQWAISVAAGVVFAVRSLEARKVFHFDGHYWDFDLDPLSYIISLVIIGFILSIIVVGIWRTVVTKSPNKKPVLYMLICFLIISVVPGIANSLSREGTISRDAFQIVWNMVTVLGFFLAVTVYTNITRNRTSIMANIIGISLVAFLVVFQGLSYFTSIEREESYDMLQKQKLARIILDPGFHPADIRYIIFLSNADCIPRSLNAGDVNPIRDSIRYELANTLIYESIAVLPEKSFQAGIMDTVSAAHPYFKGYRLAIEQFGRSLPPEKKNSRILYLRQIDKLQKIALYNRFKIKELPRDNFRRALDAYLKKTDAAFKPFRRALGDCLKSNPAEGDELRREALNYLSPMRAAGLRLYRQGMSSEYCVSFSKADTEKNIIYEAGFSYFDYRKFIHNSSIKLIYVLGAVIILMVFGFPLFFRGALVQPLRDLLNGVRRVNEGNWDAAVPVKMEDEIGFLAAAFNKMMHSVKDTNEKIDNVNHYLKNIIDSMPSVVVGVDAEGRVTHWNTAAEKKTGNKEKNVMGVYLGEVFPQLDEYMENMRMAIKNKEPQKLEKIVQRENNAITYSDLLVYPLISDGVEGAVIRIDDITSRVRLEEMMIQTEKMMSVGGLAAGMAHEINNPLSGILLATQNIQRRLAPDNENNIDTARKLGVEFEKLHAYHVKKNIPKMLEGMREMGERASKIVNNMLSFSRRSESRKNCINLSEILDKTVELASSDYDLKKNYDFRHIEIAREFAEEMPSVECVAVEIQQVVLNLIRNAAHAIRGKKYPDGERPKITLRLGAEGDSIRIEVEDNGPGMSEELRIHIFEPFFTTKDAGVGTGLGLSVSYFIITNNHHGTIAVESAPGRGTRFSITIPIKSEIS